jgi:hypothetical protein
MPEWQGNKTALTITGPKSQSTSALSCWRVTKRTGRDPFERPAIPMDDAAPAYHWSDLKMTRRLRFLAMRDLAVGFLALTAFVLTFFAIRRTHSTPRRLLHYSSGHHVVTMGPQKSRAPCLLWSSTKRHSDSTSFSSHRRSRRKLRASHDKKVAARLFFPLHAILIRTRNPSREA